MRIRGVSAVTVALAGLTTLAGCSQTTTPGAVPADTAPTSVFAPPATATDAPAGTTAPPTTALASTTRASTTLPAATTTSSASTTTTTTTATTITTSTTTSTTTASLPAEPAPPPTTVDPPMWPLDLTAPVVEIGTSVEGRPLVAERFGELGGRRVLIFGVIHGNEAAGAAIVGELRTAPPPPGVELWLVESMNPDGQAIDDRHNANHVDLNRNFPYNWGPLGQPGDGQYAGPAPASEPETQAVVNLISQMRPDIVIWYHQDLYTISPSTGRDGIIRARYAELTGLPMGQITGGTYTGVAATWARRTLEPDGSVAFIVELGESLSPDEAVLHAEAVRTIAAEG